MLWSDILMAICSLVALGTLWGLWFAARRATLRQAALRARAASTAALLRGWQNDNWKGPML